MAAPVLFHDLSPGGWHPGFYFDGSIAVDRFDLMYHDTNDVKPASSQADQGSESANQAVFGPLFAGLADFSKLSTDTVVAKNEPLITDCIIEIDCESATWELGDTVAADEDSGGTALEDQKVRKTSTAADAIGYCVRREASAVTRVLVRLVSRIVTSYSAIDTSLVVANLDLNGAADALILDADADTTISSPVDDQIDIEVGGADVITIVATAFNLLIDNFDLSLGAGSDASLLWSTGDANNHSLVLALGNSNQAVHITDQGAKATDWNVSAASNPELFIHSNTTPDMDYVRIGDHDGTEADIDLVGGTSLALKIGGTQYASLRVTGLAVGTYVAAATPGTDQLTLRSTGTVPASTGANVGHLFADFESDDDELFWLSGTVGTVTQLTT